MMREREVNDAIVLNSKAFVYSFSLIHENLYMENAMIVSVHGSSFDQWFPGSLITIIDACFQFRTLIK